VAPSKKSPETKLKSAWGAVSLLGCLVYHHLMKRIRNTTTVAVCLLLALGLAACGQRLNTSPPPDRVIDTYRY
jgi:hypothetical protein